MHVIGSITLSVFDNNFTSESSGLLQILIDGAACAKQTLYLDPPKNQKTPRALSFRIRSLTV
jgi:hypothetical protein